MYRPTNHPRPDWAMPTQVPQPPSQLEQRQMGQPSDQAFASANQAASFMPQPAAPLPPAAQPVINPPQPAIPALTEPTTPLQFQNRPAAPVLPTQAPIEANNALMNNFAGMNQQSGQELPMADQQYGNAYGKGGQPQMPTYGFTGQQQQAPAGGKGGQPQYGQYTPPNNINANTQYGGGKGGAQDRINGAYGE